MVEIGVTRSLDYSSYASSRRTNGGLIPHSLTQTSKESKQKGPKLLMEEI